MLNIAICEDNYVHAQRLRKMLEPMLVTSYAVTHFASSQELQNSSQLKKGRYDLIFMDIRLEDDTADGIRLARDINQISPATQIIFISQYLEYAPAVYSTQHVYFINKEQLDIYLKQALQQAMSNLEKVKQQYLCFKQQKKQCHILQSDILYLERVLRNTSIYVRDRNDPYKTPDRLQVLMEQLSHSFLLCHRSYVVNMKMVYTFNREEITLLNGGKIPMGRTYYGEFKKTFARIILDD